MDVGGVWRLEKWAGVDRGLARRYGRTGDLDFGCDGTVEARAGVRCEILVRQQCR